MTRPPTGMRMTDEGTVVLLLTAHTCVAEYPISISNVVWFSIAKEAISGAGKIG